MRRLLALLLILISVPLAGQTIYDYPDYQPQEKNASWLNFLSQGDRVYWQHIFEMDASRPDIVRMFASANFSGRMSIEWTETDDSTLAGILYRKLNYQKYELCYDCAPIYIKQGICRYDVRIDVRESRYRVTILNLRFDVASFTNAFDRSLLGMSATEKKEDWVDFEKTLYKNNGKLRGYVLPYLVPMLDNMWLTEYTITDKDNRILDDQW